MGLLPGGDRLWSWAPGHPLRKCKQCMFSPRLCVEGLVLSSLTSWVGGAMGRAGEVKAVGARGGGWRVGVVYSVPCLSCALAKLVGQSVPPPFPDLLPPPSTSVHVLLFCLFLLIFHPSPPQLPSPFLSFFFSFPSFFSPVPSSVFSPTALTTLSSLCLLLFLLGTNC